MIDNTCHDAKCQTNFSGAWKKYLFTGFDLAIKLPKSSQFDIDVIRELTDELKYAEIGRYKHIVQCT